MQFIQPGTEESKGVQRRKQVNMKPTLTRRNFLRLTLSAVGIVILSPFLKACSGSTPTVSPDQIPTLVPTEDIDSGLDGLGIDEFFDQAMVSVMET
jgi:hypothetical protein